MKTVLERMIAEAVLAAMEAGALARTEAPVVVVEEPGAEAHGDFATNVALTMAKAQKNAPRKIAEAIVAHLADEQGLVDRTEIAGPGFVNFFLRPVAWHGVLHEVHEKGLEFGRSDFGRGVRVQVEFVSANPTGPLHVGHGRGAAVGDAVASVLEFCGYDVQREYYVNDSGRQIRTLGRSVYLRWRELAGHSVEFPEDCYQGDYIRDLALEMSESGAAGAPDLSGMAEEDAINACASHAAKSILAGIGEDLANFGVRFDRWFSEQSLYDRGLVENTLSEMAESGLVYERDGARWFATERYGDEKDRVVVRQNGLTTYFASDIAYHKNKFERGFDKVIDVWGADHHGYIPRVRAAVEAMGYEPERFSVILVKLVNLLRAGEPVAMSTRAGKFVTLREVIDEVGPDVARFIFLTRQHESPLDFDLEAAKSEQKDNPVFYVQYAHARISSIFKEAEQRGAAMYRHRDEAVALLVEPEEIRLLRKMARYPEVVERAATLLEPHRITFFLSELAALFHAYYNRHRVIGDDPDVTRARLYLAGGVGSLIRAGLTLVGVAAPERM
ncbi:MAG: arginine--tRNA ligase [Desulfatibacillaceae bacterium]